MRAALSMLRRPFIYLALFAVVALVLGFVTSLRFAPSARMYKGTSKRPSRPEPAQQPAIAITHGDGQTPSWSFDYRRDARNYGLSSEQCHAAFPKLYLEIDRAVAYRRLDMISLEDVETAWRGDGIVRAMIWDNQLYVIENRGIWDKNHRPRALATLHSIHRAVTAYTGTLPNIEFTFTVHDWAEVGEVHHTTWAYSRGPKQESLWLMPDFGLWGWPDVGLRSYAELQSLIAQQEIEFVDKKPQLVWRGSVAVGSKDVRTHLVSATAGRAWSDVRTLDWGNATNIEENLLSMEEHCAYMFTVQTEGNTYSGRLKYLLNCQSVLISHPLKFIEHYHHLLQPDGEEQNYILVERDFSDLEGVMDRYLNGESFFDAEAIASSARATFRERYLTPAAEACYWREMIQGWREVQRFEPEFWKDVQVEKAGVTRTVQKPRGVPFEAYVIMEEVEWQLPSKPRKMCLY